MYTLQLWVRTDTSIHGRAHLCGNALHHLRMGGFPSTFLPYQRPKDWVTHQRSAIFITAVTVLLVTTTHIIWR